MRLCCVDRAMQSKVNASRQKFDITVNTERSRSISILYFGIFSRNDDNTV